MGQIYVSPMISSKELNQFKWEAISKKISSLQGIVRPPIGWSYSNCSSAWFNSSWNEVWFKYDIGITNRFIFSPTYTARYPFGTSKPFEDDALDLMILGKRKPIIVCMYWKEKLSVKNKDLFVNRRLKFLNFKSFWLWMVLCWS